MGAAGCWTILPAPSSTQVKVGHSSGWEAELPVEPDLGSALRQNRSFTERRKHDIQPGRPSLGTSAFRTDAFDRSRPSSDLRKVCFQPVPLVFEAMLKSGYSAPALRVTRGRSVPILRHSAICSNVTSGSKAVWSPAAPGPSIDDSTRQGAPVSAGRHPVGHDPKT